MIDTIKLGIPLTQSQHSKIQKLVEKDENWQWVKFQPATGELKFLRSRGSAPLDKQSFHREIRWDIPQFYISGETFLTLEFSIPKFWYGHNIHLLYNFVDPLKQLKKILDKDLHCRFADVMTWRVSRVDCCYAWRCPSQNIAQQILDSLKRLNFPRKKPIIYPETILFAGATYSVKFYLKHPEFIKHDRKALLEDKASLEWVNYLEELSEGVLRCEATLRRQYLKIKNINTVADLSQSLFSYDFSEEFLLLNDHLPDNNPQPTYACIMVILIHTLKEKYGISVTESYQRFLNKEGIPANDGDEFYAPAQTLVTTSGVELVHKGGGYTLRKTDNPTSILQYFLKKFLGENRKMQEADEIELKLLERYKPNKAARLMAMWLYVQKFGRAKAKQIFGDNPFYTAQREIKAAGCSFVEPPKSITINDEFLKSFSLDVPSNYVTNKVDDFRDAGNIINILPYLVEKNARQQSKEK